MLCLLFSGILLTQQVKTDAESIPKLQAGIASVLQPSSDNIRKLNETSLREDRNIALDEVDEYTEFAYVDMDTPLNNGFKSYMYGSCITSRTSKQYQLKNYYELGNYGIWTVNGRYCIAVGSYYTTEIGTYIDLIMENGSIIECILADCKDDKHTDATNRQNPNGSIAEFICDKWSIPTTVRTVTGDISSASEEFSGEIKYIRVYEGGFKW